MHILLSLHYRGKHARNCINARIVLYTVPPPPSYRLPKNTACIESVGRGCYHGSKLFPRLKFLARIMGHVFYLGTLWHWRLLHCQVQLLQGTWWKMEKKKKTLQQDIWMWLPWTQCSWSLVPFEGIGVSVIFQGTVQHLLLELGCCTLLLRAVQELCHSFICQLNMKLQPEAS